jgi:periplasmic protein CpxP/Spy
MAEELPASGIREPAVSSGMATHTGLLRGPGAGATLAAVHGMPLQSGTGVVMVGGSRAAVGAMRGAQAGVSRQAAGATRDTVEVLPTRDAGVIDLPQPAHALRLLMVAALAAVCAVPAASPAQSLPPGGASAPIPPPAASAAPSTGPPPVAPATPDMAQPAPPPLSPELETTIDHRIDELKKELAISAAQMPLWTAFAQAMRENAQTTDALFAQRAEAVATMSAIDNMRNYARIAQAYADSTKHLSDAFDSLYLSLSSTQRHLADTIFQHQAAAAAKAER